MWSQCSCHPLRLLIIIFSVGYLHIQHIRLLDLKLKKVPKILPKKCSNKSVGFWIHQNSTLKLNHFSRDQFIPCWEFTRSEHTKKTWRRKKADDQAWEKKCHNWKWVIPRIHLTSFNFEDMSIYAFFLEDSSEIGDYLISKNQPWFYRKFSLVLVLPPVSAVCKAAAVMQISRANPTQLQ